MTSPVRAAGVDGARGGWLIARQIGRRRPTVEFATSLDALLAELLSRQLHVVGIDIPIGLSADGHRPADNLARRHLGPRRSTFFPTPVRSVLDAESWQDASQRNRSCAGVGLSKQAWNLIPKIREVDRLWQPSIATSLVEVHPELSFAQMNGEPVMTKKSDHDGSVERRTLLAQHVALPGASGAQRRAFIDSVVESVPRKFHIDAVDALAVLWSANRFVRGHAIRIGGELDPAGRPMALVI